MINKAISVIGSGFVGFNLAQVFFEKGLTVYSYDIAKKLPTGAQWPETLHGVPFPSENLTNFVVACEQKDNFENVYFVCLPTPMLEDGDCDLSIIEGVLNELASVPGERIAVVKSTVPPGSTRRWNEIYNKQGLTIIHSPEFLREASALNDMRNQDRIILGGPKPQIDIVRNIFRVAFPNVPIYKTSSSNSEMVKYFTNTFLSVKVLFANEIYEICEKLFENGEDIDYDRIIELATLDKRINASHLQVPGPMPADDGTGKLLRGISGSCMCKDINALIALTKKIQVQSEILIASWAKNLRIRPQRDWEKLIGRAVSVKK